MFSLLCWYLWSTRVGYWVALLLLRYRFITFLLHHGATHVLVPTGGSAPTRCSLLRWTLIYNVLHVGPGMCSREVRCATSSSLTDSQWAVLKEQKNAYKRKVSSRSPSVGGSSLVMSILRSMGNVFPTHLGFVIIMTCLHRSPNVPSLPLSLQQPVIAPHRLSFCECSCSHYSLLSSLSTMTTVMDDESWLSLWDYSPPWCILTPLPCFVLFQYLLKWHSILQCEPFLNFIRYAFILYTSNSVLFSTGFLGSTSAPVPLPSSVLLSGLFLMVVLPLFRWSPPPCLPQGFQGSTMVEAPRLSSDVALSNLNSFSDTACPSQLISWSQLGVKCWHRTPFPNPCLLFQPQSINTGCQLQRGPSPLLTQLSQLLLLTVRLRFFFFMFSSQDQGSSADHAHIHQRGN